MQREQLEFKFRKFGVLVWRVSSNVRTSSDTICNKARLNFDTHFITLSARYSVAIFPDVITQVKCRTFMAQAPQGPAHPARCLGGWPKRLRRRSGACFPRGERCLALCQCPTLAARAPAKRKEPQAGSGRARRAVGGLRELGRRPGPLQRPGPRRWGGVLATGRCPFRREPGAISAPCERGFLGRIWGAGGRPLCARALWGRCKGPAPLTQRDAPAGRAPAARETCDWRRVRSRSDSDRSRPVFTVQSALRGRAALPQPPSAAHPNSARAEPVQDPPGPSR